MKEREEGAGGVGDVERGKEKAESLIYPKACKIVTFKSWRSQARAYRSGNTVEK